MGNEPDTWGDRPPSLELWEEGLQKSPPKVTADYNPDVRDFLKNFGLDEKAAGAAGPALRNMDSADLRRFNELYKENIPKFGLENTPEYNLASANFVWDVVNGKIDSKLPSGALANLKSAIKEAAAYAKTRPELLAKQYGPARRLIQIEATFEVNKFSLGRFFSGSAEMMEGEAQKRYLYAVGQSNARSRAIEAIANPVTLGSENTEQSRTVISGMPVTFVQTAPLIKPKAADQITQMDITGSVPKKNVKAHKNLEDVNPKTHHTANYRSAISHAIHREPAHAPVPSHRRRFNRSLANEASHASIPGGIEGVIREAGINLGKMLDNTIGQVLKPIFPASKKNSNFWNVSAPKF